MLEEKILETIKKYDMINKKDRIVIGVSGGPDSISLLNVLYNLKEKLDIKIYVAHINHMIRKEADEETEFVKKFANNLGIECYVKKVKVEEEAKKLKIGTEEAGRNIRYNFFEEVANSVGANKIATAHNSNDNAETVLMNIIRGTSISGLKGIVKVRSEKFIRPLIECTREEIEEYCRIKKLNPRYDKSNDENIYTRNKIRNLLIPFIKKEFNPNIIESINRLSNIAYEEEEYIQKIVKKEFKDLLLDTSEEMKKNSNFGVENNYIGNNIIKSNIIILDLHKFNKLDNVIKSKIILYTIAKVYGKTTGIEKIHIDDIIKLCGNNIGNKYLVPKKGLHVLVKKGKIFFSLSEPSVDE